MLVDCGTCTVRGASCQDCVVTYFIASSALDQPHEETVQLDVHERAALKVLASSGMVPPLRMAPRSRRASG